MIKGSANTYLERKMNKFGSSREPFFFMIDFEGKNTLVRPLSDLGDIQYDFHNTATSLPSLDSSLVWESYAPSLNDYMRAYDIVQESLHRGDSYLVNLTFKSFIETNLSLQEIYNHTTATYKLHVPGVLSMFSPESFVSIKNNVISSYPMKGTIKSSISNAREEILTDRKEFAEHSTIVDLIRNDLSIVSKNVKVSRWRYIDEILTSEGGLLQVSSQIDGNLDQDWHDHIGTIISKLLPAGSISGAPKKKTVEIIRKAEDRDRGWYTGICGVYDGETLDSAVMIRMVTEEDGLKYFHSGGGITAMSDLHGEYQELQDKIYVPISRDDQDIQRSSISSCTA